jgi:MFS family permease
MIGLVVGLYSVTNIPANIFFGRLIDKVSYKRPLILGLLGDAICMFCYSLCTLPVHLAILRSFHGMTGGLAGPATMSAAVEHAPDDGKGKAMGLYGISLAIATLVGYGLSGVFTSHLGYKSVFYFGAALLLIGMLLTFIMPTGKANTIGEARTPIKEQLIKIGKLLRRRGLITSYCSIFATYFAFGSIVTLLPLHVKNLGMEAFHVGMLLTIFVAMFILFQFPSGIISDRVGRWIPTTTGLSFGVISLAILPQLGSFPSLAMIMALYGAGYAMIFPSVSALVADYAAPEERGMATGIFHALLTAGVAVGAPVVGWIAGLAEIGVGLAFASGILALVLIMILTSHQRYRT